MNQRDIELPNARILQRVQLLLCSTRIKNDDTELVSRERISKHVSAATDTNTTIALLLGTVFSARSVQNGFNEDNWSDPVEGGYNRGTLFLRPSKLEEP
jgi:hypothetical protein